ncbi:polyprenyl synthetase family protein [Nonomuraea sediminis]|uniref:polyprenyl synthetase family protein n=1 Tax=Nonomuraea sediminis TaxID=2835864 RepID=UPI001BDCA90C|nr:polyprenyl synthetase family protein [Nonomuraea sediminis]
MDPGHSRTSWSGEDELLRVRRLAEPALREAIAGLHPWGERMASFTLGWADVDGRPYEGDGGKSLRPAIAMLAAEAVGATAEAALPGAVAVELVHAFSLVHDDIIDRDERRRHRPALWKAYGVGPAILAGDALLALAIGRLAREGDPLAGRYLSSALIDLVHGQTLDMAFEDRPWIGPEAVTVAEYTEMAAGKTGSLLAAAASLGVILGGAPSLAEPMWQMGRDLGVAFQIADDLLGIWGDPSQTGKPVYSDLRRAKKTLPVLAALPVSPELAALLGVETSDEDHREAAELIERAGGRATALDLAESHLTAALTTLRDTLPEADSLHALCAALVHRTH